VDVAPPSPESKDTARHAITATIEHCSEDPAPAWIGAVAGWECGGWDEQPGSMAAKHSKAAAREDPI